MLRTVTVASLVGILLGGPLAACLAHAHDGNTITRTGLSPAARGPSGSLARVGPTRSMSGRFHAIFGDAPSGSGAGAVSGYVLIDDKGGATELLVDEQVLRAIGGGRAVNHRRVIVTGQAVTSALPVATPLFAVQTLQVDGPQPTVADVAAAMAVTGPQPWVTILCRFADLAGMTPEPVSYFNSLMLGTVAPGLDHFWREVSFNNVNIVGSAVHGWYTLPQPRSYYVYGSPAQLDFQRAADDCTGVADADVYFPGFVGVNLMFNSDLDGFAWGGSWTLTRDGAARNYRMTWVPPWGYENQGPIAHEMGHGFGLPHSSGPYLATYDSRWDLMSDIWDNCPPLDPTYGCVGPHTISYHKDLLGWIPAAQKYVAAPNTSRTITIERLGQPTSTTNYLMAQLPIGTSTTQFYTVEVRRFAGYDTKLPGEAVVIHRVDTTRSDRDAQVVDIDGNGNPNDSAAMWLPGETFADPTNGLTVIVNAQTATAFQVTIARGVVRSKTFTVPPCRLVDTRLAGGPIPAYGTRSFVVAGTLSGQGGAADCHIPRGSKAVYVNVVAVNPAGPGHFTVYPYGSLLPVASTLNFAAGQTIANGVLVPICDAATASCAYDLTVAMGPAASHVVMDVSGYVAPPP